MKICWIGNSYCYFNDLPEMVAQMLEAGVPCRDVAPARPWAEA